MSKYKISDIQVGDEVYFIVNWQSNYDLYWKVISIVNEHSIEVEIQEMGANARTFLDIKDIHHLQKIT